LRGISAGVIDEYYARASHGNLIRLRERERSEKAR